MGTSTTFLSKHILQTIISVYKSIIINSKISRTTQAPGHNPLHHPPPPGGGVVKCANSNITKHKLQTIARQEIPMHN